MAYSYTNNPGPYYDNNSFQDEASYGYSYDPVASGSWSMERQNSGESGYQQDFEAVAEENQYQDDLSSAHHYDYSESSNGGVDDTWPAEGYPEGYYSSEMIKQEPGVHDNNPSPSGSLTIAQIIASTPDELHETARCVTETAAYLIASNGFNHLEAQYITSDAIELRLINTGEIREAIQDVLEQHLLWYLNTDSSASMTLLLEEAACQMQWRLTGPKRQGICYYAILCALQKLRGGDEETTPESHQAPAKSSEKTLHVCTVPECNNKPFGRSADLDRHIRMLHSDNKKEYYCDYSKCARSENGGNPFFRHDHFRDHLRDQHKEDLLRRSVKPDKEWWSTRSPRAVMKGWWRCSRCLAHRVNIERYGYSCPGCGNSCEIERQKYRQSLPRKSS